MERPYPHIAPYCVYFALLVLLPAVTTNLFAQEPAKDSTGKHNKFRSVTDTAVKTAGQLFQLKKQQAFDKYKSRLAALKTIAAKPSLSRQDTVKYDFNNPFKKLLTTKPLVRLTGGYAAYNFHYRSAMDTPYVDKNIAQHNLTGRLNVTVAGQLPVQVNYWVRKSNSAFFKDIADVQVAFNAGEFNSGLQNALQKRLMALSGGLKDSLTDKLYQLKQLQLGNLTNELKRSFSAQRLAEAYEIIHVKGVTYSPHLPDSTNIQREDSLRKAAAFFLEQYSKIKAEYDRLARQADSLKLLVQQNLAKINRFREMVNGLKQEPLSARKLRSKLDEFGAQHIQVPAKYRWLMGLRNFSLGRSTANYSELTAKNISVNGINFEYNSWYYLAVLAGTVNYRFRDFVVNGFDKKPQTLYMLRAGIGRLQKNYFIVSAYRGQKHLFTTAASDRPVITITGISAETRWQLNRTTWLTAEAAKSMAPDFRNNPPEKRTTLNFSDKTNQAYAFRFYTYIPVTNSRIEAFYKQAGANFQSFSSYQTNAALESWYVKAEQNLFKRRLRIVASLRKNEFTNPFIVQDYKSNTVFKSLTATLRMRKWPVITAGYQPMMQLTVLNNVVMENRFQSLVASLYHLYKIKGIQTASTLLVNKFYNSSADTGFLYYNATNAYWMQNLFFNRFTANIGASHTKNPQYMLNVLDAGIQPRVTKMGTLGIGIKINSLNNEIIKVGGYLNAGIRVYKQNMIHVSYEHGYLPGFNGGLVSNEMATVQFTKMF